MKYVIVGGVAGGASAAARLRRIDESADIIMIEKGEYISYANCGLPYYIGNTIADRNSLFLQTPISFGNRYNVDVRINSEVSHINRQEKVITIQHLKSGKIYQETYDKLLLSPGAIPIVPPIRGINLPHIYTIRNVNDTDTIKTNLVNNYANAKEALIVGGGFIGLEMAENLHRLGMHVTIVEKAKQVMTVLDLPIAAAVHEELTLKNVKLVMNNGVVQFEQQGEHIVTLLENGEKIESNFVILSIGVKPNSTLALQAGLKIAENGGIQVNEHLQTSDDAIYAVGDAISYKSPLASFKFCNFLAGPANKQARIAADNMVFNNTCSYKGSIGTAIAKVFDLTAGATGLSEETLKREHIDYLTSITHPFSHAGYYPNAKQMTIKINFAPKSGLLLGAQVVGNEGVDKRIDILATVISNGGTTDDLIQIEHAYAPPYSSAKEAVNFAGFVAENILQKLVFPIHCHEFLPILNDPQKIKEYFIIDVRTVMENKNGTIEGAVNYPVDELREFLEDIPKDKPIIVFCAVGLRGYIASRILLQSGFSRVYNLSGGYKTFQLFKKFFNQ